MDDDFKVPVMKESNSIKLNRGMKNTYGWEIKIAGDDEADILKRIEETDKKLRESYAENLNTKQGGKT